MTQSTTEQLTGSWQIDASHSEVAFTVRHLMSKVRGTFTAFQGTIETPSDDLTQASVQVRIDMSSVNTNNEQRDGHLRSTDIFDVEKNPEMTFASTAITDNGDGDYTITGDLTINGTTRSVDLAAEYLGVDVDAYGVTRLGAEAKTQINRKDFGVDFNVPLDGGKVLLGDKLDITLTIEATKN
ncbi:YceI family protein [Naumannella cuiyingiana]|uniref:Polyisoprenoid-binding protein YceI n=1 Tax=Naumannella cuiyingiana TaxID=1347891 RepID=A0A7Z0D769_9ACTN|nr:YceI family protein [Naumannella cuiyingiana]NYI70108.1 polyisoprenoid-binding protein YceI [Naumannella cuiyingiana]